MSATSIQSWLGHAAEWALSLSLAVALPAFVALALSHLRLIPARWCALLSAVILIRLLIPWALPVGWKAGFEMAGSRTNEPSPEPIAMAVAADEFVAAETAPRASVSSVNWPREAWPFVWTAGSVMCLLWLGVSQVRLARELRWATPADAQLHALLCDCCESAKIRRLPSLLVAPGLDTVGILGWLRPRLLVPPDFLQRHSHDEACGILLHELQHLKRRDGLWTWLGLTACALHWFNPLSWLLFRRFCADRELACDEAVVRRLSATSRRSYGEALLKAAERFVSAPAMLPSFSVNPTELKHRIKLIMKPQPSSLLLQAVAAVIGIGIAVFTFTTARADEEKEKPSAERKASAENQVRKPARDGEVREGEGRTVRRDGERADTGERDGDRPGTGSRNGEGVKRGARDGEGEKRGPRDGENPRTGPRDGEGEKRGARDGEGGRRGPRDGEAPKTGARDGEGEKRGARDGDGDRKRTREGDGDGRKPAGRDDEQITDSRSKGDGQGRESAGGQPESASKARLMVLSLDAEGNVVTSDGRTVPMDEVRAKLQSIVASNPDQPFSIRASESAPLDRVMQVMQAAKDAGVKNITLGNR